MKNVLPPIENVESSSREHHVFREINNETCIAPVPELLTNEQGLAAEFEIGMSTFRVVDVRRDTDAGLANSEQFEVNPDSSVDFLIIEDDASAEYPSSVLGLKGLRRGETVKLGREHLRERFLYDSLISREHLSITYDEGHVMFEDTSTNGTRLTLHEPFMTSNEQGSERYDRETLEGGSQPAPAYESVANIFDDEIRGQVAHLIEDKFFSEEYGEIGRLVAEKQRLEKAFEEVAHDVTDPRFRELNTQIHEVTQQLTERYGRKIYEYYDDVETVRSLRKSRAEAHDTYVIQDSDLARGMLKEVLTTGSVAEECKNTTIFVSPELFNKQFDGNPKLKLSITGETVDVPLAAIVSAEGFESWEDGRGYGHGSLKDGRTSREVIDDYAARETDIPPIDDLTVYVMPSGEYFAKTNNAHRVGAAKKKGNESIKVKSGIDVVLVEAKPRSLQSGAPWHQ